MSRFMLPTVLVVLGGCSQPVTEEDAIASLGYAVITRDEALPGKPVTSVVFNSTAVSDAKLEQLAPFKNLTTLELYAGVNVTDAGVKHVANLTSLTRLTLGNVPVTDSGLRRLAALKNLATLNLSYSGGSPKFTDAGVEELRKVLPNCTIVLNVSTR